MEFPTDIQNKIKSFLIGWKIKAGDRFEMYKLGIGEIIILDVKTAYNIITIQGYKYFYSRSHNECKEKYFFEIKTEEPTKYKDFSYEDPYIILSRKYLITGNRYMIKINDKFKTKYGFIKIINVYFTDLDNYLKIDGYIQNDRSSYYYFQRLAYVRINTDFKFITDEFILSKDFLI